MRLFLAILLLSSSQLATQMILPALPAIASHFALSDADAQQIIMLYFISFGLSQLFYGPWVDALGMRRVFYAGLGVFLLGSILCFSAASEQMLALGRILQGLGAGSPFILSRVILSNTLHGDKMKKAFGSLAIAASITSIAAPFVGGLLTAASGWQSVFGIFTLHLLVALVAGFKLLPQEQKSKRKFSLRGALQDYAALATDSRFISAGLFKWLPTLMFLSLATFLPFEMQKRFGMSADQYGSFMMVPLFGLLIGSTIARLLLKYVRSSSIIAIFWPLALVSSLILMFYPPSIWSTLTAVSLFMVLGGTYYASSVQLAVAPFKEKGGTASALVGSIDMCVFSLIAALVNRYWVTDLYRLGELFLLCSLLIGLSWIVLKARLRSEKQNVLCQSNES